LRELTTWNTEHGTLVTEVLVVDDGSTDGTAAVAERFTAHLPLRVIRLSENRGKGAAVREGVLAASGDAVVFMDADGATPPDVLAAMAQALNTFPVVVGNRWITGSHVRDREPFRAFSGWVYRTYVGLFGLRGIDTMCGFKGFRHEVARSLFEHLLHERWLFDTEVMLRARHRKIPIGRVPISWTSKHGSKLHPSVLVRAFFEIPFLALRVGHGK
jgi:glycosyltransferase involved in cell wall biosynthesis